MTHRIAVIVYPDVQILDATGPVAAFEIASRYSPGAYALSLRAVTSGPVASSSGVTLIAEALGDAAAADTLMIAGGDGSRAAMREPALKELVQRAAAGGRRIASVCSGAYVLAEAGVLDGRRATTHWARAEDFARRFPKVRLEADRIWVRDGDIWSSAGITAGIDLALALIAEDLGEGVAKRVAQQLVVYHRRPGGQSQFSALLDLDPGAGRFAAVLAWARERLAEPLGVERLADRAGMSPRHFARAFMAEVGVTPAKAVERLRLDAARGAVESSSLGIDGIARQAGFGDPERMRRAFVRAFGQPPQALRRASRAG